MSGIVTIEKAWGRELVIANRSGFCGKHMLLRGGKRCSLHYHGCKDESFYVIRGRMLVEIGHPGCAPNETVADVASFVLYAHGHVDVPQGTLHRFSAFPGEDCEFIEFSSTDDPADSYRIEPSGDVPVGATVGS